MSFRQAIRKLEGKEPTEGTSLKDGVLVRIKKDSPFYDISESNPANISGTLYRRNVSFGDHIWEVQWSNGTVNRYRTTDLEVVS